MYMYVHPSTGTYPVFHMSCTVYICDLIYLWHVHDITYLPHKAVAEVSKDKEPIGRGRVEFNWFESHLISGSNELRVK